MFDIRLPKSAADPLFRILRDSREDSCEDSVPCAVLLGSRIRTHNSGLYADATYASRPIVSLFERRDYRLHFRSPLGRLSY